MVECPNIRRIEAALAGGLDAADALQVQEHVRDCPTCARTLATLRMQDTRSTPESCAGGSRADFHATAPTREAPAPELYDFLSPALAAGEMGRLGRYRVLGMLGTGGMGVVFDAEDTVLRRRVALKAMQPALAASTGYRQRFAREARSAAALADDHVVTIFDVGEDRGIPFLAMELLSGESLEQRLRRRGRLSAAETARIGRQAALGLAAAHGRGLVHRDIKPDNLWIESRQGRGGARGATERVKILDFGIARGAAEGSASERSLTQPARIIGTAGYLSPEQARGEPAGPPSDLFAMGCVLYRACTGQPAFPGATETARIMAVETHDPAPPASLAMDVPRELSDLILRLLAKQPADRPGSAAAVADELETIETACHVSPTVDSQPVPIGVPAHASAASGIGPSAAHAAGAPATAPSRQLNAAARSDWSIKLFGIKLNLGLSFSIGLTVTALLLIAGLAFYAPPRKAQSIALSPTSEDSKAAKLVPPAAKLGISAEEGSRSDSAMVEVPPRDAVERPLADDGLPPTPGTLDDEPVDTGMQGDGPAPTPGATGTIVETPPDEIDPELPAKWAIDVPDAQRENHLSDAVDYLAQETERFLETSATKQVAILPFDGPPDAPGKVGMAHALSEKLASRFRIARGAPLSLRGRLTGGIDKETAQFCLSVNAEIIDFDGARQQTLTPLLVFNETAGLTLLGSTAELPLAAGDRADLLRQRGAAIVHSLAAPRSRIDGAVVRASADSPFGLEILTIDEGQSTPKDVVDIAGRAFVSMIDQPYAVRLINDAPHSVGVELTIHGVNTLAFSRDRQFAASGRWVLRPRSTGVVEGWHDVGSQVKALRLNWLGDRSLDDLGLESDSITAVTAVFCAAWEDPAHPPEDEPQLFSARGETSAGGGATAEGTIRAVGLRFGVPRAAITIRCQRSAPPE
jgi:serine/threonine protein kinase